MCSYSVSIKLLHYSLGINKSEQFKAWLSDMQYQILVLMEWRGLYQSSME